MAAHHLVMGTRGSALARAQTSWVVRALVAAHGSKLSVDEQVFSTRGDEILDRSLPEIGGKGLFTAELEAALLAGKIDFAVHSLKDLPVEVPAGLVLAAIPERASPWDVLVSSTGRTWETLRPGDIVGTSSPRRQAQLEAHVPGLRVVPLRGNVPTRLAKVALGDPENAVLAEAGFDRLGLAPPGAQVLTALQMVPAPGQGALGIQARAADERTLELLAPLHHRATHREVQAERELLRLLGGGCSAAVGAIARAGTRDELHLTAIRFHEDGRFEHAEDRGTEPLWLAAKVARELSQLEM